jgi:hypothetical protein
MIYNNFNILMLKIKKYYFNIHLVKKYFKKNTLHHNIKYITCFNMICGSLIKFTLIFEIFLKKIEIHLIGNIKINI